MTNPTPPPPPTHSAEEKIKDAARKVFTCKGFDGARTRDIAAEAGVNLALLNYYFRGKQQLFEVVMMEQMLAFRETMVGVFTDASTTLDRKVELLAGNYIDLFLRQPDLPVFFVNQLRASEEFLLKKITPIRTFENSSFFKQIEVATAHKKQPRPSPFHILMNIGGMSMFPFLISPLVRHRGKLTDAQFDAMMKDRKRLIPLWIRAMLDAND